MAAPAAWKPYDKLTDAPTNLKEAIDWVLRVTGKDGKKNVAAQPQPSTNKGPHCLCYLAKAVKDLLYDARSPGSPGPHPDRYWDDLLLTEESTIVKPVLTDLGLVSTGSTSAASSTRAGGTEVIKTLIDHLALGLQKWVGWQEDDKCCLKGDKSTRESKGMGRKCDCTGAQCCTNGGASYECEKCGKGTGTNKCYISSYGTTLRSSVENTIIGHKPIWKDVSNDSTKVHLLARIFLGSVCLIWSGLSQLGFLTGDKRWKDDTLSQVDKGLGSFMAAVGYDLERLNQGGDKKGDFLWKLLSGQEPSDEKNRIKWKEFTGDSANQSKSTSSVVPMYPRDEIYKNAKEALKKDKSTKTEEICTKYPLLVLHILASGYFRAGSAGANKITPAKPATGDPKKPLQPRTIREILYWLSALPYSEKYCQLVDRMDGKMKGILPKEQQDSLNLEGIKGSNGASTTLQRKDITHYLLAACGYCPLVLIGIQGTIATSGNDTPATGVVMWTNGVVGSSGGNSNGNNQGGSPNQNNGNDKRCPKHSKDRNYRCTLDDKDKTTVTAPAAPTGQPLQAGEVCYGGYHLAVKDFGPLHGMYANGLFGFQMDLSPAQCLDQLRIYVYHCFYQLYFLRKQCGVGVVDNKAVLGWKSCRYGKDVKWSASTWLCSASSTGGNGQGCQCKTIPSPSSPLMAFLCDGLGPLRCGVTVGKSVNKYPEIEEHIESKDTIQPPHFGKPPIHCPVPMGWQAEASGSTSDGQVRENHFKGNGKYPAHCTGNTLALLLEYYCDPGKCPSGTLVVLLRLLACITPTVPRTLGDLFGFYYYIVYIGGNKSGVGEGVYEKLTKELKAVRLDMLGSGNDKVVKALQWWNKDGACQPGSHSGVTTGSLKTLYGCNNNSNTDNNCCQYLSPLSGQQYGQLSPAMAGTYLSWLVYLIGEFKTGLEGLKGEFQDISCKDSECKGAGGAGGCGNGTCTSGTHGNSNTCCCDSVVSCTGVLPVLYKYGFGYGDVESIGSASWSLGPDKRKCHKFLKQLDAIIKDEENTHFKNLINEINQLIYTTRLPWIFVLTLAWLVAVLYLAFGAIWPLDWTHMRSHCRGWFRKGSLSPWEVLMVGKKKGRGILEFFGGK
uniref:Variant erythrocyte surface antigen-1, beta subunit n=1 Tax=Babesia bovis TaxID=5865 RepID=A7AVC0_BABBO|eukprot:XP_001609314.1 variant erythrocyte surface antigen-1, beta subunit [Babesia bovis T2Bo]